MEAAAAVRARGVSKSVRRRGRARPGRPGRRAGPGPRARRPERRRQVHPAGAPARAGRRRPRPAGDPRHRRSAGSLVVPAGVAGFVDGPGLYPSLTPRQNLAALASLRGGRCRRTSTRRSTQVGLADVADDRVRGFSLGMRQRLGLASAMLTRPRLLVLDEPANGLDPAGRRHVNRVIAGLAADGCRRRALQPPDGRPRRRSAPRSPSSTAGRVVFSGPVEKLAAESRRPRLPAADHRPRRRPGAGRRGARACGPRRATPERPTRHDRPAGGPRLRCRRSTTWSSGWSAPASAIRELAPVVPPLEAAFLALTGTRASRRSRLPATTAARRRPGSPSRPRRSPRATASSWSSC